jgi:hypothetical protein
LNVAVSAAVRAASVATVRGQPASGHSKGADHRPTPLPHFPAPLRATSIIIASAATKWSSTHPLAARPMLGTLVCGRPSPISPTRADYLILRNQIWHLWHGCHSSARCSQLAFQCLAEKGGLYAIDPSTTFSFEPLGPSGGLIVCTHRKTRWPSKKRKFYLPGRGFDIAADDGGIDQQLRCVRQKLRSWICPG